MVVRAVFDDGQPHRESIHRCRLLRMQCGEIIEVIGDVAEGHSLVPALATQRVIPPFIWEGFPPPEDRKPSA